MHKAPARTFSLAVDIGGTFTDLIVLGGDGATHTAKVLSTFDDLINGIAVGLRDVLADNEIAPSEVAALVHASTVGTNTVLEGRGAVTGLVTTRGFRDVLEIGRLRRPTMYDPFWRKPPPIVARRLRVEVGERTRADGSVAEALREDDVSAAIDELARQGAQSVAVSLLHSYAAPEHERRVGAAVAERLPGVHVSLSHEVLPEIREFERTSTTVINAYIRPEITRYLDRFKRVLADAGIEAPLSMMQSSGGIVEERVARERPVAIVESGPAAGALATAAMTAERGIGNAIAFDMGGTTAKASVIEDGSPEMAFEYEVGAGMSAASPLLKGGGYALRGPTVAIAEVGAGGGSIASVDVGGAVQVGPESAGADPGPACYARGGLAPTVTDANVVLGYLSPQAIAGGRLAIDRELAVDAIDGIATALGAGVLDAAYGIHVIANENMARAVRAVTVERGRDPRDYALVAFGGSGPLHAAGLARAIGISRVIVPAKAGLFSALGLLFADVRHDGVATVQRRLADLEDSELSEHFAALEARTRTADGLVATYAADVRYAGQSSELVIDVPGLGAGVCARLRDAFREEYAQQYGHAGSGTEEIVSVRVTLTAAAQRRSRFAELAPADGEGDRGTRPAYFGRELGTLEARVIGGRAALAEEHGPLVIEEEDTTILVPPDATARLDPAGNVVIELETHA